MAKYTDLISQDLSRLLTEIRQCRECASALPCPPRPVLAAAVEAKVLIIGQAPGRRVQESGIAWDDPSGNRLREWLGIDSETFYNESFIALMPMGFCYPGTGKSGDLPPRPECAPLWHDSLLALMPHIQLTLLIGTYSQRYYLGNNTKKTLTETVAAWEDYQPHYLPLPHPSPRNNIWIKKNPWFEDNILPYLKQRISELRNNQT